jgi:hypothetical protein
MSHHRFREFHRGAASRVYGLIADRVASVESSPPDWLAKKAAELGHVEPGRWLRLIAASKKALGFAMFNEHGEAVYLILNKQAQTILPKQLWQP